MNVVGVTVVSTHSKPCGAEIVGALAAGAVLATGA
jgi:hypothetical protein